MLMTIDAPMAPPPPAPILIHERDLVRWLSIAQPGEQFVYHRGFLAVDASSNSTNLSQPQRQMLQQMANRVADLVARGLVQAVQHRHGECDCTYIVIASKRLNSARRRLGDAMQGLQARSASR